MDEEPIAFFITWTCYGTWLPGDDRGWAKWHKGEQLAQPLLADWCRDQMLETPVCLDLVQREIVNQIVAKHCKIRHWQLHVVNCRSNHCHVVVSATNYDGELVRDQFKSWGKRKLKEKQRRDGISESEIREHWWTRKGSVRHLFDDESLDAAIVYARDVQEFGGSKIDL